MTKTGHPNFYTSELITNPSGTEQIVGSIPQTQHLQHTTTTNEPTTEVPQNYQQYSTMLRTAKPKTLFTEQGYYSLQQGHPIPQNGEYYANPELQNGMGNNISPSFPMTSITTPESQNGFLQQQYQKQQKQQQAYQPHDPYSNSMYGGMSNGKQFLSRTRNRSTPVCSTLGNQQQNSDNNNQQLALPGGPVAPAGPTLYNSNSAPMLYTQQPQMQMSYSPAGNATNTSSGNQIYSLQGPHTLLNLPVRNSISVPGTQPNGTRASSRSSHSRSNSKDNGQPGEYPDVVRPKIATTFWESENTICYQVRSRGFLVSRREDTNYVNGTKLLNVIGMTRGKRDGILKTEKTKIVVKVGSMNLKGVWIPFDRAYEIARNEGVDGLLYPLFVKDLKSYYMKEGHKLKSEDNEDEDGHSSAGSKLMNSDNPIEHMTDSTAKPNMFRDEYYDRSVKEEELSYYGTAQNNTPMNKPR
ncbi:uncharacterized protein SPAPADRAFT_66101 [Spathaspora passalidarum NRRL Y-27907]|uniref:HTH APSES-type domain-containing protein n=1 Tax=Spathaspora passalidarum (strain NRRL Y-27907 / 11-Y1) TaxID=619300 RepID=G3AL53_SPAPN|nr:uncharacterized protein SPAPADRAFT_66101 [Spathaspora passalidarum NRRL Y-27907]EGW33096.1 hypothetical protein SPAPADRAFT_66101 [Spathaspora passalidarum NRRL Y-27907]